GLREQGDTRQWSTIKKILCTHTRSTIILHGEENRIVALSLLQPPLKVNLSVFVYIPALANSLFLCHVAFFLSITVPYAEL
ncbi:MAG: hypothetical protein XE08_0365, partial [Parcubacteria bacterium 32_520]